MRIDIISDTICPWCFIGKRRLERALEERPDLDVEIAWHPFQLNPDMPSGGLDRETYLNAKFGGEQRAAQIYAAITAAGAEEGIEFDFAGIKRTPNTLDSHCLIHWAAGAGCQDQVVEKLFELYFLDGRDIGDRVVLIEVARQAGMDGDKVEELFATGQDLAFIRDEDAAARDLGVAGVPFFIVDRKFAVSGAQDPRVFLQVFDLALKEAAEEASASAAAAEADA